MNRHSLLYGNDPEQSDGRCQRGQRVFCSNRGQRGGCGKTFSVFLAQVLPRHTINARLLWKVLSAWLAGASLKASHEEVRLPLALETLYHLVQRLRARLDQVRARLCRQRKAPDSPHEDPLLQTVEHLRQVFCAALCPVSEFQFVFQRPLLG